MQAISDVIKFLGWLQEALYKAYIEINDLPWPFWMAAWPFYLATDAVNRLAWAFYDFYFWLETLSFKVSSFLNWNNIWDAVKRNIPSLELIQDWFYERWEWFTEQVTLWWAETSQWVLDRIDIAKAWAWLWIDYLDTEINALKARLDNLVIEFPDVTELLSWFTNWWGNVRVELESWWTGVLPEVQSLIDSNLKTWFPFYDELVSLWGDIKEFFTDPEDWLYKSLDRIVERFW